MIASNYKVRGEITYPFPNFNGGTVHWVCDYLSMLGLKLIDVSKRAPGIVLCQDTPQYTRWHEMETFSALLALCAENSPVWINDWVNNREAGDLRRHRTHDDVIVMEYDHIVTLFCWSCVSSSWWIRVIYVCVAGIRVTVWFHQCQQYRYISTETEIEIEVNSNSQQVACNSLDQLHLTRTLYRFWNILESKSSLCQEFGYWVIWRTFVIGRCHVLTILACSSVI